MSVKERVLQQMNTMSEQELLQLEQSLKRSRELPSNTPAQSLVAFLQTSPWADVELDLERSSEATRTIEF